MCGIIGYTGKKYNAKDAIIDGLKNLEYRGYDSAGISTVEKNGLSIMKDKQTLSMITSEVLNKMELIIEETNPDIVLVTLSPSFVLSSENKVKKLSWIVFLRFSLVCSELNTGIISISSIKPIIGDIASP